MQCPQCGYSSDKKQRSNNQNRYYRGVVIARLSEHTGFTPEEMHEVLKWKFLRGWKTLNTKQGFKEAEYTRSTAELDTKEFEAYMTKVREFASIELSCWIPEPNEQIACGAL